MKKLLLLTAVAFMAFSCSEPKTIEGNISNLTGIVTLSFPDADPKIEPVNATVENGQFIFSYEFPYQGIIALTKIGDMRAFTNIMIDSTTMNLSITGDIANPKEIAVVGSAPNILYANIIKENIFGYKSKEIDFIKANPNSIVAAFILNRMSDFTTLKDLIEYKKIINPSLYSTPYIKSLDKTIAIMESVTVGKKFIDIKLPTPDGTEVALSEVLKKNKYVLLDFWASWCAPCRRENPNIVKAYNMFNKKGFSVYGVSLDNSNKKDAWVKAIKNDELTWTNVSDLKGWQCVPAKQYAVRGIPASFLISSDGTIVAINLKGDHLIHELSKLLK